MRRQHHACVFITSWASSGFETTMVETSPSRRCIKGPCLLAMSLNARWGKEPTNWCMFPIIGSFHGPGGRFKVEWLVLDLFPSYFHYHENKEQEGEQEWEGDQGMEFHEDSRLD